ncbi:DNA-methyltransferase [Arenimonas sp.]|jgi:site-specific DNA-methyltransferase (adenine-specific)|uniref:DNA-methyltransferase n=1 Tax=Arenimonas sp. TaxID=1872635 RepID=UPI0037C0E615
MRQTKNVTDIELNKVYNENCLETLKKMKDGSVNAVITSPPYNMNLRIRNGKYCSRQIVKELSTKYSNFDDNLPIDEYYELHLNILKELLRVSDMVFYNIQIVTGSKRAIFKIIGNLSDYLKDIVIWDKGHGQPAMAERVMNRRTELILIFDKNNAISRQFDKCNFNRGTLDDLWLIKRGQKVSSEHGAVFPEQLVYTILNNFTNEGDIIYDPFMGTGSTAVVSKKLKRNYIGSEISNEYMKVINERLSAVSETLF